MTARAQLAAEAARARDEATARAMIAEVARLVVEAADRGEGWAEELTRIAHSERPPIDLSHIHGGCRRGVGAVYCIADGDVVKIGWTGRSLRARLGGLQVGNPRPLRLLGGFAGPQRLEALIHAALAPRHVRGEWYDVSQDELRVRGFCSPHALMRRML